MVEIKEVAAMILELEEAELARLQNNDDYVRGKELEARDHVLLQTGVKLAAQRAVVAFLKQVAETGEVPAP